MRKFVLVLLASFPLFAQENPDHFLARVRAGILHEAISPVVVDATPSPLATKTFNITAKQFEFDVTPTPFVVNQGDSVTLNITVPSNDGSGSFGHGFFLESYFEPASPFLINRGQTRTVSFVANTPGTFTYICSQSSCGTGHSLMNGTFTVQAVQAAAPSISSLNPSTGPTNGGTIVSITGANFVNGATVKFGTSNGIGVIFNSSTNLTATAPAHAAGTVTVTVTNPDGQSGTSTYTYADPTLSITAVSPNTGPTTGGTAVTITGSNFQGGASVTFGGVAATNVSVVNSTTITATTPLGPATEQLAVDVTVTNPDGKSATQTRAFNYTVPALTIDTVAPTNVITTGGQQLTISGTGFTTALTSSVTIGGVPATGVTVISPVTMIAVAPPHAAGSVTVVVAMGSSTATKTNALTYIVFTAPAHRHAVRH